jgi:hypothetical protein
MALLVAVFGALGMLERRGEATGAQTAASPQVREAPPLVDLSTLAAQAPARAAYPSARAVAAARRYAAARKGVVSFATIDTEGRLRGHYSRRVHSSASVAKAMLLISYLRRINARGERLTAWARARLEPMIRRSDNRSANEIHATVGTAGLGGLARAAGMRRFTPTSAWGGSQVTPADQARLFRRIGRLTPKPHRAYARRLLATVVPWQRWGIPRALPGGWRIFFKGGWRPTASGRLVNQAALLEHRDGRRISIAVLTDGNPSHEYGAQTVRGIAARLLGGG